MKNDVISPITSVSYLADYELKKNFEDLDKLQEMLSEQEEEILLEILELEKDIELQGSLMDNILEATKKGAIDYIDAMTDTGETFDRLKDPSKVRETDTIEVIRKNPPADPEKAAKIRPRTKHEAHYNPFDADADATTSGMSEKGASKFENFKKAYTQRTKSITALSHKENTIHTSNPKENNESLAGLRSYRVGPVVPMTPLDEVITNYNNDLALDMVNNIPDWIRRQNFEKFDAHLIKEFGFENAKEAEKWRRANHLTIHEGADGMFLVPTDIHDKTSHSGYCSNLRTLLKGNATEEQKKIFNENIVKEKVEFVKHECSVRGTRLAKGIALSAVKDLLKCGIVVIVKESMIEFKEKSKNSLQKRIVNILHKSWAHVKQKCKSILSSLLNNVKGSIVSEFLTLLNDFIMRTFKNVFKIVRQMWSSIKSAFKIICSKNKEYTWQEKVFEATKILSAGIVGLIGFSLNELLDKGLSSIGVPFSSFISECLSGLFTGIVSFPFFGRY